MGVYPFDRSSHAQKDCGCRISRIRLQEAGNLTVCTGFSGTGGLDREETRRETYLGKEKRNSGRPVRNPDLCNWPGWLWPGSGNQSSGDFPGKLSDGSETKKTALLEWNDHGDFERIGRFAGKEWRETDQSRNKGEVFRIMEVDYYKMADPSVLSFCLGRDYHYIILDYGEVTESSLCECARCDRKILVGSLSEWKAEAFLEVLEQAGNRDESWRMAVVSGGEDTRREIEKLFRCRLQRLPASADAFRITREEIPCFENLLFARRGRAR